MLDLIAQLLLLFEELKFWKKKKKRREIEKQQNLPKKTMVNPVTLGIIISVFSLLFFGYLLKTFYSNPNELKTIRKIKEVIKILDKQKKDIGKYPVELNEIIRNNPLRKNINVDAWGNEFYYNQLEGGLDYELKSKGKDGIINTGDDLDNHPQ